jgi:O-antigen/teichoic acid export membrane protein
MGSRVFRRRAATVVATYGATVLGILTGVAAARMLGDYRFGVFAIVLSAVGFFQLLLDSTVEEAVVKYGFRYAAEERWGRLRRLFRVALATKCAGGVAAAAAVLALAPLAESIFGAEGLFVPLLLGSLIPLVQAPEAVAGAALLVRGRYDLRSWFFVVSMALRLAGVGLGATQGISEAVVGYVLAQVLASTLIGAAGLAALRRFPRVQPEQLGEDARSIRRFVLQSAAGSGLVSMRQTLAPLLLGVVSNPVQVGYFRIAQAPLTGFTALSSPVRLIMLTDQTRDVERGRVDLLWRSVRRYSLGAALLALVTVPLAWPLMPWLVRTVFGAEYAPAADAARVLLLAAAVQLVLGWTKSFPVSVGRPALRIVAHGIETLVLVPLVLVLGAGWDATGAAVAYLCATLAFALVWVVLVLRLRGAPLARPGGAGEAVAP